MSSTPGCGGSIESRTGLCRPEGDTSAPSAGSSSITLGVGWHEAEGCCGAGDTQQVMEVTW